MSSPAVPAAPVTGNDRESSGISRREEEKVHVAVGTSVGKGEELLLWTFRRFMCSEVVLVHVHRPSSTIPTLLGNLPVKQASNDAVEAHRKEEKNDMNALLFGYTNMCSKNKVKVSMVVIENSTEQEGIVQLINEHEIKRLVMETTCSKFAKLKNSKKTAYISKNAPLFCEIWFVFKKKHIGTREGTGILVSPIEEVLMMQSPSTSHDCYHNVLSEEGNGEQVETSGRESPAKTSIKEKKSSLINPKDEEYSDEAMASDKELIENVKQRKMVKHVTSPDKTTKMLESKLQIERKEKQKLLKEREEDMEKLQKSRETIAFLHEHAEEIRSQKDKLEDELKLNQASIISLKVEMHVIRHKMDEARRRLELREHHAPNVPCCDGFLRFTNEASDFMEFSLSDLQNATCDFSESFKIGHGIYGCVYKGEMLDISVAIKKLHTHYRHGQLDFQQEVHVLSRLKHPHLVTLLGACTEAWSVVSEYMPNGSLQDQLFQKSKSFQLTWKHRVRITAEISDVLLYMHSLKPVMVIHGDLKPKNIFLDSKFSCKIGDFGICRLAQENILHSPSFRSNGEFKGRFAYEDPEYQRTGELTTKSDVYSFGLIILQLLTGRPLEGLVNKVRLAILEGSLSSVLDMTAGEWPIHVSLRLAEFALQCCEPNSRDRPELTAVTVRELKQLLVLDEKPVPNYFLCPILREIMHDPQLAADGFTYEGQALRSWLKNGRDTSPMTNLKLDHLNLTPNHFLRYAIQDWLQSSRCKPANQVLANVCNR